MTPDGLKHQPLWFEEDSILNPGTFLSIESHHVNEKDNERYDIIRCDSQLKKM